jgi:hypothetical protein
MDGHRRSHPGWDAIWVLEQSSTDINSLTGDCKVSEVILKNRKEKPNRIEMLATTALKSLCIICGYLRDLRENCICPKIVLGIK